MPTPPSVDAHGHDAITVPRPHVPFGPMDLPPQTADAIYLHRAARELEERQRPVDHHLRGAVVKLIHDAADAIDRGGSTRTAAYHIRRDEADPLNSVIVVEPNGRSWHIHREDADHRHHDMPHRLAAGWFGDRSA